MQVHHISYDLFSNQEIEKTDIVIRSVKNNSEIETAKDPRLGPTDNTLCQTCHRPEYKCYGHWGKLPIRHVLVRPSHLQHVLHVSKFICLYCGTLKTSSPYSVEAKQMLSQDTKAAKAWIRKTQKDILNKKNGVCWNVACGEKIIKLTLNPKKKNMFSYKKRVNRQNNDNDYPTTKLYELFSNIPKLYYPIIGCKISPTNLFYVKHIPIPPTIIRPPNSFWLDDVRKESSELTILLTNLIRHVKANSEEYIIQKALNEYDNTRINAQQGRQASISLSSILIGKTNMIRSCILGGRKDHTFRTIVGPEETIKLWEVGVSEHITKRLGTRMYVNEFTIKTVIDMLHKGQVKSYYNSQTNTLILIKPNRKIKGHINFLPGDWIERDLQINDHIIFGRQPSLHRHNLVSGCLSITDGHTIKIPQVICNSQNADFDGDEMHGIIQSNPKSIIEQSILLSPINVILHDLLGVPVYGNIQDDILAAYLLGNEQNLSLNEVNYLLKNSPELLQKDYPPNKTSFTGKDVISIVFNQNQQNMSLKNILKDGQVIVESIDASLIVGQKKKSLAKLIIETSNKIDGAKFINALSFLLRRFLRFRQYGVIFSDLCPNIEYIRAINNININSFDSIKKSIQEYYTDVENGKIVRLEETLENKMIDTVLGSILSKNIHIINNLVSDQLKKNPENSLYIMTSAGYKMNPTELMYILGSYGQQKLEGKKMSRIVNNRILPYHLPDTIDPEAFGFVLNPLLIGLTGTQFYFTMAAARSQIVDIVCETSRTGSMARKINKKLEDCVVDENGMVCFNNNIIKYACNDLKISKQDADSTVLILPKPTHVWYPEILSIWKQIGSSFLVSNRTQILTHIPFFVNIQMFLDSLPENIDTITLSKSMSHDYLFKRILTFVDYIKIKYFFTVSQTDSTKYILLTYLDPSEFNISEESLNRLFNKIEYRLKFSLSPGYSVGIIYAQTLSEKFTQQALSNFHTTAKSGGVASSLGFDTFLKTVSLVKNVKNKLVIFISEDVERLEILQNNFQFVCLSYLSPQISIEEDDPVVAITISIKFVNLFKHGLLVPQLELMIEQCLSKLAMIIKWSYYTEIVNREGINIHIRATLSDFLINKSKIVLILHSGIYKGKITPNRFPIELLKQYPPDGSVKKVNSYKLSLTMDSLADLTKFDLIGVDVITDAWDCYYAYGIESVKNRIIDNVLNSYGAGFEYLYPCCNLLGSVMCVGPIPENINTFKSSKTSVIKKLVSNDYKALASAAVAGVVDPINDNSTAHFVCQPIKCGTGMFDYLIDLNPFANIIESVEEKNNLALINDIKNL